MDGVTGRMLVSGVAHGRLLIAEKPISFWGGIDAKTGQIIDTRHDRVGESIAGRIFAFPSEKGSSTASAVLVELLRIGRAPAAVVTASVCPVLALGSLIGTELYGIGVPILQLSSGDIAKLEEGAIVRLTEDGVLSPAPDG